MNFKKIFLLSLMTVFLFGSASFALANQINIAYSQTGDIQVSNPETSQSFYDQLSSKPRDYFITTTQNFNLYLNLMVPEAVNSTGRYSLTLYSVNNGTAQQIGTLNGDTFNWQEYYDSFTRDYYYKGPELNQTLAPGQYKIEVSSKNNQGKYVLVVGKKESYTASSLLNIYWQLPLLKLNFLKTSPLQFFLTPFGIAGIAAVGVLLILVMFIFYAVDVITQSIREKQAKTLFLTSSGMHMKDEIIKLLQKPAYDISLAFITTAAKPVQDISYVQTDWDIMKEVGFNVEEVDIEGKTEEQVYKLLEFKDIIFVEGGNTFYLLNAMRKCSFEKTIIKLLKLGKVYVGSSAGSIVAGKNIQIAELLGDKNEVSLKNLRGLNLVPFNIFCHYQPGFAEVIKQKIPNPKKRYKNLRILTDEQAILVQGKKIDLIGQGEQIIL